MAATPPAPDQHWTGRHGKPIVFVILILVVAGIYLATTVPVSVFPEVDFPRVLVGVDNGVAPIDQMQVTITRPVEEALNSVQGLDHVQCLHHRSRHHMCSASIPRSHHRVDCRPADVPPRGAAGPCGSPWRRAR